VHDPERYGVVEFDLILMCFLLKKNQQSNYAVPGLYFYDNSVVPLLKILRLQPGNNEITDVNKRLLRQAELKVRVLDRGQLGWIPEHLNL
jgi:glucose-1-phosphate thymidylyltransferase